MPHKRHCPLCRRPTDPVVAPFCSRGCRDRDLIAWFGEDYRTPGHPVEDEAGEGIPPPAARDED